MNRIPFLESALVLALVGLAPGTAQAQRTCAPKLDSRSIASTPLPPCDFYSATGQKTPDTLANFAWNTFIGVNWPAQSPFEAPFDRGVSDTSVPFGTTGTAGVVWDSWREKRELYRVQKNGTKYTFVAPPPFNDGKPPSNVGPNDQIGLCPGVTAPTGAHVTALQSSKIENYLDETDEIGLDVLWRNTTPLPTEESLVRYQVKFSQDYYDQVMNGKLWNPDTLNAAITAEQNGGNGIGVVLSSGDNVTNRTGAILTKSAWMMLNATEIGSGKYYEKPAIYYREVNNAPCVDYATFGLIALHIIRNTTEFPYLFFSTFEHVDNFPNVFSYANVVGNPSTNKDGKKVPASTVTNAFGLPYKYPPKPSPQTLKTAYADPIPATKIVQPLDAVSKANAAALAGPLKGTLWANYQLVGYQHTPIDGAAKLGIYYQGTPYGYPGEGKGLHPHFTENQTYYLANPVVESSQRFQFFEGGFNTSGTPNIAIYPNKPVSAQINPTLNMGGCMGCHGNTQSTGMSFTLSNQTSEPKGYSAESLPEKCEEIGYDFDATKQACVPKS